MGEMPDLTHRKIKRMNLKSIQYCLSYLIQKTQSAKLIHYHYKALLNNIVFLWNLKKTSETKIIISRSCSNGGLNAIIWYHLNVEQ